MTMAAPCTLQLLIVDDEPLARLRLAQLVADIAQAPEGEEGGEGAGQLVGEPLAQVAGEAADVASALRWLQQHHADAVLLDVQMPGALGTQLAQALRALVQPPELVFVTAHPQHAVQAFELEAADFLTKPVRRERLAQALLRVRRRIDAAHRPLVPGAAPAEAALVVSERGRVVRVPLQEVLYLKAELKYVTLHTQAHTYVLDDSLADLQLRLGAAVVRVHRNTLVALQAVRALHRDPSTERWEVVLGMAALRLPVSRRLLASVKQALAGQGV